MNMVECTISNYKVSQQKQWDILLFLYKKYLHKDKIWHFFYELYTNIIRCSRRFEGKVQRYLKKQKVDFEVKNEWVDNQEITRKYQDQFQNVFHANSEIIMRMALDPTYKSMDIFFVGDRFIHCFLLNCNYIAKSWKSDSNGKDHWESYLTHVIADQRRKYIEFLQDELSKSTCKPEDYDLDYFEKKDKNDET